MMANELEKIIGAKATWVGDPPRKLGEIDYFFPCGCYASSTNLGFDVSWWPCDKHDIQYPATCSSCGALLLRRWDGAWMCPDCEF